MSDTTFPPSPQQRQLWRQQRQAGAAPFRTSCSVVVEGPLDPALLRAALADRVERHDLLRSTFLPGPDGEPVPTVAAPAGTNGGVGDGIWSNEEAGEGLRARLEELAPGRHRLHLDLPALLADARGLENLIGEVALAYAALGRGEAPAAVPVQFGVLARWQNEILASAEGALGRQFWARQDLSALAARLPWEDAAGAARPFAPAALPVVFPGVPGEVVAGLARLVPGVSAAEALEACWHAVLARLAGAGVVVGSAAGGRAYPEVEDAVGPFARDLPLALRLDLGTPFAAAARCLAEARAEAWEWQEYFTWDPLQQALGAAGSLFFPFAFEHRVAAAPVSAGGLWFRFERVDGCHDRFRVRLRAREVAGGLDVELLYDTAVLEEGAAARLAEQVAALAAAVVAEPHREIGALPRIGPAERRLLLDLAVAAPASGGSGGSAGPRGLLGAFEERAREAPAQAAVFACGAVLSYGDLDARANQLAHHLRALGVREGDLVGALLDRSAAMPVAIFGILKAGAAYLPLDPAQPVERLEMALRDSGARRLVCVAEPPAGSALSALDGRVSLERDAGAIAARPHSAPPLHLVAGSPAYVMYTSGSTGEPRGVVVTHGGLAHYVLALRQAIGLVPEDRYLHTASVAFSSSARQLFVPLSHGAAVVVASPEERLDTGALWRAVRERGVTVVDLVPSVWRGSRRQVEALSAPAAAALLDNRLRLGLSASEPLLSDVAAAWSAALGARTRLVNLYGQTETTGIVASHPIPPSGEAAGSVVPAGRPLPGTALHLLDDRGGLVPLGAVGEIAVGGPTVASGYLGRPGETAERFVPDPWGGAVGGRLYRTGDLGRRQPGGTVDFLGRRDQQVKVRGLRVEPGEVEAALARHPAVREAAVVLDPGSGPGRERLVAYLVPRGELPGAEEIRAHLRRFLPEPMIPAAFVSLAALPLTANGKLDRRALPAPESDSQVPYVAPRDEMERQLASLWQEMLGLPRVGVRESFFALGGHSLLASLVVSRLRDTFEVELPVLALFRSPTIAGLAEEIRQAGAASLGKIAPAAAGAGVDGADGFDGVDGLPADLDGLSDEQVNDLLARLMAGEGDG